MSLHHYTTCRLHICRTYIYRYSIYTCSSTITIRRFAQAWSLIDKVSPVQYRRSVDYSGSNLLKFNAICCSSIFKINSIHTIHKDYFYTDGQRTVFNSVLFTSILSTFTSRVFTFFTFFYNPRVLER